MTDRFTDPTGLSRFSIALMMVLCVVWGLAMFLTARVTATLREADGENDPVALLRMQDEITESGRVLEQMSGVVLALGILSGVVFLRWTYVVACNAHYFSPGLSEPPGMGVGWYFVPIANFFKPWLAMNEYVEASRPRGYDRSVLLGGWWILHLLALAADRFVAIYAESLFAQGALQDILRGFEILLISMGLFVALNVVASVMVQRVTGLQLAMAHSLAGFDGECANCGEPLQPGDTACRTCGRIVETGATFGDAGDEAGDDAGDQFEFDR